MSTMQHKHLTPNCVIVNLHKPLRLFIAIPLSREVQSQFSHILHTIRPKLQALTPRMTTQDSWHFTLIFLGNQQQEQVSIIGNAMQKIGTSITAPKIHFDEFTYGPPVYGKPSETARMVWAVTTRETSRELETIRNALAAELKTRNVLWEETKRPYTGHITLARFEPQSLHALPQIEQKLPSAYRAISIDLIQSTLTPTGARYQKLFSQQLP